MSRRRFGDTPKAKKKKILIPLLLVIIVGVLFIPGSNGLAKVLSKNYRKQQLEKQIERLKIKAELIEAKIARAQDPTYLRQYLRDNYGMVPKDSMLDK